MFLPSTTNVLFYAPTPFGWLPLEWYSHHSGLLTFTMIAFALGAGFWLFIRSLRTWCLSFAALLFMNVLFFLMTLGGATSCIKEGCEVAEAMGIAYSWHLATLQIIVVLFATSGLGQLVNTFWDELSAAFGWFTTLSVWTKGILLVTPGAAATLLVAAMGIHHANNVELVRLLLDTLVFQILWTAVLVPAAPGMWMLMRESMRR